jgi:hypothetical protein
VLRVHRPRVARRDPEEAGIEKVDRTEKSAVAVVRLPGRIGIGIGIGIEVLLDVESTGRNGRDGVAPLEQVLPVVVWCICVARETARRADDREGCVSEALGLCEALLHLFELVERAPKQLSRGSWCPGFVVADTFSYIIVTNAHQLLHVYNRAAYL